MAAEDRENAKQDGDGQTRPIAHRISQPARKYPEESTSKKDDGEETEEKVETTSDIKPTKRKPSLVFVNGKLLYIFQDTNLLIIQRLSRQQT